MYERLLSQKKEDYLCLKTKKNHIREDEFEEKNKLPLEELEVQVMFAI